MRKVAALYEAEHPDIAFAPQTYKPSELPSKSADPAVVITLGDKEMAALIASGAVDKSDARTFATNTYPLAVVAPAKGVKDLKKLDDLAKPSVKHVFVDDPAQSTLGSRAADAFQKMGLWEKVRAKALPPAPGAMVLGELLAGKADAAVVFKDCLFGESGEGGSPPKTIRIVGELPSDLYAPIPYQAAVLKTAARPEVARRFVDFLTQEEGRQALRKAGLKPAS
jgi:molybdate transport system substrate-binding protein